jgi:hypothetical protein
MKEHLKLKPFISGNAQKGFIVGTNYDEEVLEDKQHSFVLVSCEQEPIQGHYELHIDTNVWDISCSTIQLQAIPLFLRAVRACVKELRLKQAIQRQKELEESKKDVPNL